MTDNELRKLKRTDLLELLLAQEKENEDLRRQLQEAQARLEERKLALEEAGSIAEASLRLSGVFEAAQTAADQYLESVRRLSEGQEARCARLEEESRQKAERLQQETEERKPTERSRPAKSTRPQNEHRQTPPKKRVRKSKER